MRLDGKAIIDVRPRLQPPTTPGLMVGFFMLGASGGSFLVLLFLPLLDSGTAPAGTTGGEFDRRGKLALC